MDRKILTSILAIGLVSVLASAATFTWLSDQEQISWTIHVKTAELEAPDELVFTEKLAPGESTEQDITVTNIGETALVVTLSAESNGVEFSFKPNGFKLKPDESKTVKVTATLDEDHTESGVTVTAKIFVDGVQVQP